MSKTKTTSNTQTQLATQSAQEPVQGGTITVPADMAWIGEARDHFDRADMAIPFLRVLQDLSPQVKKRDPAYLDGAEAGMILHTATNELTPGETGVVVVPVKYQHNLTEWVPRSEGGGFVADHGDDLRLLTEARKTDKGAMVLPNGNELVEAAMYYALMLDGERPPSHVVISMTGFGWRAARNWNVHMSVLKVVGPDGQYMSAPPVFVGAWRLRTQPEQNDKGSFFRWSAPEFMCSTFALPNASYVLAQVRALREGLTSGVVRADTANSRDATATATATATDDGIGF